MISSDKQCLRGNLTLLTASLILGWTLVSALSLAWNLYCEIKNNRALAVKEAVSTLNKDLAIRLWAVSQGGAYVHFSDSKEVNPYLDHLADRDISRSSGESLTLLSPDSIMRRIDAGTELENGVRGRLISLDPLNPENAPDDWEREQLIRLVRGEKEFSEFTPIDGVPYLRLLRPLYTEQSCLKCHGVQKKKIGDVHGGISVSVPMTPYLVLQRKEMVILGVTHGVIWLSGILGIILLMNRMKQAIVEQERSQRLLNDIASQLEKSNQELENFAHVVSHDLQEPLQVIMALGTRLRERHGETLSEHGNRYLNHIELTAGRMQALIRGLLDFASVAKEKRRFRKIDLSQLVRDVLADLAVRIEAADGVVEVGTLCEIDGDELQMRQLLQNLIGNALKYHRPGVAPVVSVYAELTDDGSSCPTRHCRITVKDNGIGFSEQEGERIFDIFHRLHDRRVYEGAGIGLGICKKIAQHHGGEITFESVPGTGTKFFVTLPVTQSASC